MSFLPTRLNQAPIGTENHENQDEAKASTYWTQHLDWNGRPLSRNHPLRVFTEPKLSPWDYLRREYSTYDSHNSRPIRRGLVRFFIQRHNRPALAYVESKERIRELTFRNDKGETISRKVNILTLQVANEGNSEAISPRVGVSFHFRKGEKWLSAFFLELQPSSAMEIENIPLGTDKPIADIEEKRFAYALITKGLMKVDDLMQKTATPFVVAFAFEAKDRFYFASENIVEIGFGGATRISLTGHASNMPTAPLSWDMEFLLWARKWDDLSLVESEEELPFGR